MLYTLGRMAQYWHHYNPIKYFLIILNDPSNAWCALVISHMPRVQFRWTRAPCDVWDIINLIIVGLIVYSTCPMYLTQYSDISVHYHALCYSSQFKLLCLNAALMHELTPLYRVTWIWYRRVVRMLFFRLLDPSHRQNLPVVVSNVFLF